jgi:dTDP-4-dehydrorhamnose reductase
MQIAVVGQNGYVGMALYEELKRFSEHSVIGVTRENYSDMQKKDFDVLINCAMPSGRFWAKNNPEEDFTETVKKTADLLYSWKFKKFVQVSTVSARCQLDTVYGRHKAAAEKLCDFGDNLIVRLGALYSENMKKGVLVDMLEEKTVYVDAKSRYSFISLSFCASWISSNLNHKGIVELGGKNAVSLEDVAKHLGIDVKFEGELNHQDIDNPQDDLPEASQVLSFLNDLKKYA